MKIKRASKTLSLFLAFCMVFTMLPTVAFAETGDVDSGVPLGVSSIIIAFADLEDDIAEQKVDIGAPEEELKLPNELAVTLTEGGIDTATGSDASKETQTTVAVSDWTAEPEYNGDTAGIYTFTPVLDLPESLTLAEGVTAPTITVTVREEITAPMAKGMAAPLGVGTITGTMNVGGTMFSDLTQDANGTGWTWDAVSATLTLDSSYQGDYIKFACADTDTINLVCNGTVTVNKGDTYAIQSWGSLVIRGDGPLTISGGLRASKDIIILGTIGDISGSSSSGIDAGGSISIYGAVGNITGVYAIYANGDITISDVAVVGKIGAGGTGPNSSAYGIYSQNGSVTINGATGDISGQYYGIHAKGGNAFINGTTGAISSTSGSNSGDSAIRASVGVAINGTTGAISSKGDYGIYAESGAVLIAGKTGDITGMKAFGILAEAGGITIPSGAVVGKIAGAQSGIEAGGSVTIGGKTGDITGIAGSTFGGGIQTTGSVTITGETGAITSTHPSIPAIGAGGDVTIVGSVGEIAVTAPSGGSGYGILALGSIHIINSVTVSSFNGAFNKAPTTLPSPSYTAFWSDNSDGSGSSTGSAYVWSASHKYVKIEKDSGMSAPTVSGFRAGRTDADKVSFFFTPSTTGKYGCQIEKKGTPAPTFLGMFHDITAIVEIGIDAKEDSVTASDILVVYLQIENAEGVKSQIYSFEVPAYTPPVDAAAPIITGQPIGAIYDKNEPAAALSVTAGVTDGGTLSYQWYSNTTNSTTDGTPVGTNSNTYTPSTAMVGTTYYYCVVTNTNNEATANKTATATSDAAAVTVNASGGTIIRFITVTGIVEPVGGAAPVKTGATVPVDANYALWEDIVWVDDENKTEPLADGAKFEAGKRYLCGVSVKLPSRHSFAHDVTATINGKTATVMLDGTEEAVVSYLFTAKDATDTPTITITKHPQNVTVTQGRINATLTAEAVSNNGKPVLYQWYRFIGGIGGDNVEIMPGATSSNFTIPTGLTAGTYQYLCIFNTDDTDYTDSNTAIVTVKPPSGGGGSGDSGGGSSGDNGSSGVVVTPPALDAPNAPTQGSVNIHGTVDASGTVTANITNQTVIDAIDRALTQARQNGTEQNGIILTLNISTGGKPVNNLSANLPKEVQDAIIAKGVSGLIITAGDSDIAIGMDLAALREMNRQAGGNINLTATRRNNATLAGNARAAIGNRPVFDLNANYGNGSTVQNFGAGSVSITIPYTLSANENAGNIQAVYVDANGKVQWLISSVYDGLNEVLRFSTNHFSTYGVGYKQDVPSFTDIGTHWAKEDIAFVANRGLLSGTSKTTFSPNTAMTRGMFVTALGRLANADVSGYKKSSFTDVKSDAYYMGYIEWANKNNIVKGIGDGKFAPDQSITRDQMAVILQSYAKAIGFTLPKVHAENTFADSAKIGAYAKDAVKQMQMAGIISGKNSNLFDPQGTATRAEVSAVLRRFVELAISSDTAQGWTMNDSGKWMYYENGKPVTGKKNIGGSAYTFDQYGVTADVPKNLRYTTYTVQKGDSFWLIAHKLGCTMSELERLNNKSRFDLIHPGDVLRVPEE